MRMHDEMRDLAAWGWDFAWEKLWSEGRYPGDPARVVATDRGSLLLQAASGTGRGVVGHGPGGAASSYLPTVGDWCAVTTESGGRLWRVHSRLPRRTVLVRLGAGRTTLAQELAANVDKAFLVCGLDTDQGLRSLTRLLAIVLDGGVEPVVLLNKTDLHPDTGDALECAHRVLDGRPALPVSALSGQGLDTLSSFLRPGATIALLGPSGAGKSTLINALMARSEGAHATGLPAATAPIRDRDGRGRHTTTRRRLYRLAGSALLLDTPGLRELGVWDDADGMEQAFADVHGFASLCRFRDCRHDGEPGCAVREALMRGELEPDRFHRYLELLAEAASLSDRRRGRARVEAARRSKQVRRFRRDRDRSRADQT